MTSRLQVLQVAAALLLLNAVLSFVNWWPTPAIKPDFRLAPEFVGYWLVLLSLIALRGSLSSTMLKWLALVYLLLVIGRYGDVTVPALFGRSLNLYWDSYQVPIVLSVLARKVPLWIPVLIVLVSVLSLWGLVPADPVGDSNRCRSGRSSSIKIEDGMDGDVSSDRAGRV